MKCARFTWKIAVLASLGSSVAGDAPLEASGTLGGSGIPVSAELFKRLDANGDGHLVSEEIPSDQQRLFDRLLRTADQNNDGTILPEEFAQGLEPTAPPKPIEQPRTSDRQSGATRLLLLRMDTNCDAVLTRDEAPEELVGVFDRFVEQIDGNKDQRLDLRELTQGGGHLARAAQRIARQRDWDVIADLRRLEAMEGEDAFRFDKPFNPQAMLSDPKQAKRLFSQFDANGDKRLTMQELPASVRERIGRQMQRIDADQSGDVSESEFSLAAERLARMVPDARRRLMNAKPEDRPKRSAGESRAKKATPERAEKTFRRQDRDKDNYVSREEARGLLGQRFDAVDTNRDGRISKRELSEALRRFQRSN